MDIENTVLDDEEIVEGEEPQEGKQGKEAEEPVPIEERVTALERELKFANREKDDLRRRLARAESLARPGGVGRIPRAAAESEDEDGDPEDIDNRRRLEPEAPKPLSGEKLKEAVVKELVENFPYVVKHPKGERATQLALSELQESGHVVIGETDPFVIVERVGKLATKMLEEYDGRKKEPDAGKKQEATTARRKDVVGARASNAGPAGPKSKNNEDDEDLLSAIPRL